MKLVIDIPIATARHPRLLGDFYLPEIITGQTPVALVIHGGGWTHSDKSSLAPVCTLLAQRGVASFSINYRRLSEAPWPACVEDCSTAFELLADPAFLSSYGLNARPLLVVGASAGGHLALMTALARPAGQIAAILAIAPPVNLSVNAPCCDPHLFTPAFFERFFGHTKEVNEAMLREASPLSLVNRGSPPLWLVHSCNDTLVFPSHSREIANAYKASNRPVREHWFDGPDFVHGLWQDDSVVLRNMTPAFETALSTALEEIISHPLLFRLSKPASFA